MKYARMESKAINGIRPASLWKGGAWRMRTKDVILNTNIYIVYINYIYKSSTDRDKILTFMKNTICDFLKTKILRKGT